MKVPEIPVIAPTPEPQKRLPNHLAPLDALRGVAVSLVFLQHLGDRWLPAFEIALGTLFGARTTLHGIALACLHHAHVGVDLFFVLSGFSLGYAELRRGAESAPDRDRKTEPRGLDPCERERAGRSSQTRSFDLRGFYTRRLRRILPGYAAATLLVALTHPLRLLTKESLLTLLGYLFVVQGYVELPSGFIGASWSLTTELHAYVLFPFLWLLLQARSRRTTGIVLAGVLLFSWSLRLLALVYFARFGGRTWWLLELTQHRLVFVRLDQFVLGAACALLFAKHHFAISPSESKRGYSRRSLGGLSIAVGALLVVVGACIEEPGWGTLGYAGGYPFVSLGMTAIVGGAVFRAPSSDPKAPSRLEKIGRASYGFFLNHQWMIGLTTAAFAKLSVRFVSSTSLASVFVVGSIAYVLSYGLGDFSRRFIEEPFLRTKSAKKFSDPALRRDETKS